MKVLIIRLSAMGDIIHGLPAAAVLKEKLPGLELSWLLEPAGIPLLEGNPAVDRLIVFPKSRWRKQLSSVSGIPATALEASRFASELRGLKFDAVIDLQGLLKSSLLGFLSNSKLRFGFKGTREGAESFLTHRFDPGDYFGAKHHVVEMNLALAHYMCRVLEGKTSDKLASAYPDPSIYKNAGFPLPAPEPGRLEKLETLLAASCGERSPVVLIPGTTWKSKIWPEKNWVEFARLLSAKTGSPLILVGGPLEQEANKRIASQLKELLIDLTGKTDLADLLALFHLAGLVVGADTGPLHLAAAVGKAQVLAIFGSTPYARNGPYGPRCSSVSLELECQPCFSRVCPLGTLACLENLSPQLVLSKLSI